MKILELRFQNLNSLYGEWIIDFSDPQYACNGIFAMTGPTGAGKSTILDAICLALYGATPRLGRITKSSNEIMSRGTGECYAEVLFQAQRGLFRCHWGQHRARKKMDGNLADARHEIVDVHTGKLIETKKSLVKGVIEKKTGMDFERFTRSMLLAQGGFDTFLKAGVEEKSKILEQITGTEIYTEISRRTHERERSERDKLNILLAETSNITILDPGQEKEARDELKTQQKQETALASKVSKIREAITWLTAIADLKKEIVILSEESAKLTTRFEQFRPDRERLQWALKVAELDGDYATLSTLRKVQQEDRITLRSFEKDLPRLESSVVQKKVSCTRAEELTVQAKKKLKGMAPLLQKVRSLDQQIADQKKVVDSGEADCKNDLEQIDIVHKLKSKELIKRDKVDKDLEIVTEYLETHSRDVWLVSGFAGIEQQFTYFISVQKELSLLSKTEKKARGRLKAAVTLLKNSANQLSSWKQKVKSTEEALAQGKEKLALLLDNRLLREYRTEKEVLLREMAFLSRIRELEDYRSKLEDGSPCPLCGSEQHPYAEGNIPEQDDIEQKIEQLSDLIRNAEGEESNIKRLRKARQTALASLHDSEKDEAKAGNEKKAVQKILADIHNDIKNKEIRFAELKSSIISKLQPLGIQDVSDVDMVSLLMSLQKRLTYWQARVKQKEDLEKQRAGLASEIQRLCAVAETQQKALTQKQLVLEMTTKESSEISLKRQKLFGSKIPDTEETRLNQVVSKAEREEKQTRSICDAARQELHSAKSNIVSLIKRIEGRNVELKELEAMFISRLGAAGVSDELQFRKSHLSVSDREKLNAQAKALDGKQTELLVTQKDREKRLARELARKLTESNREELVPIHQETEESLNQLRETVAGLTHKLAENSSAKERIKEKQLSVELQQKECRRWEKLHNLIGSADGKKYRNFAQGLTFELMVAHANKQLTKMTDRYLLIRDKLQPLELNVIDNYQAGEVRSTKNLSGGESFIVSLTLALGLSKMASRRVRVDSLFLDEGFGTLDEEALETALETLSSLQESGKLIGIISHVPALKGRIATQLTVTPLSGGKSRISGPGCRLLSQV